MAFPPFIAPILGIANIAALIGVSALCIIIPFHALEALYGTSPPATEKSLSTYLLYCCTVVALRLDRKTGEPIPLTPIKLRKQVQSTLIKVLLQTLFTSFLQVYDWAPFPSPRNDQSFIPLSTMFHWGHILNNMLIAGETNRFVHLVCPDKYTVLLIVDLCESCRSLTTPLLPLFCFPLYRPSPCVLCRLHQYGIGFRCRNSWSGRCNDYRQSHD